MIKKVSFDSAGRNLKGTLFIPEQKIDQNPGVIFYHGMTSSEDRYLKIAEETEKQGMIAMTVSLGGHGESDGNFDNLTVNDGLEDGLNAYDFFTTQNLADPTNLGICGASFGGAIAAIISEKRKVKSLVLRAPAAYGNEMMSWTFGKLMSYEGKLFNEMIIVKDTPSVRALAQFGGNLLVISSENDTIIPTEMSKAYLNAAVKAKKKGEYLIKGATHNLSDDKWREEFIKETVNWFSKTL